MDADVLSSLTDADLVALGCLALPTVSVDAETLQQFARAAAKKAKIADGRRSPEKWRAAMEGWLALGLLVEPESGKLAVPHERAGVVRVALSRRPELLRAVRDALMAEFGPMHGLCPRIEARFALYAGDPQGVQRELQRLAAEHRASDARELAVKAVEDCFGPLTPALIELEPAAVRPLLSFFFDRVTEQGGPLPEDARALLRRAELDTRARAAIYQIFVTGSDGGLLDGLEEEAHGWVQEGRALLALAAGDAAGCRDAALRAWRAIPRRVKKPCLDGPYADFLAYVLATGEGEAVAAARTHLESVAGKRNRPMTITERLALVHLDGSKLPHPTSRPDWSEIVAHVTLALARGESAPPVPLAVEKALLQNGYVWLSVQIEALRAWREMPSNPPEHLVFHRILRRRAPWEAALDAIEAELGPFGDDANALEQEGVERLVWWADVFDDPYRGGKMVVQPRLQRRNKRGWTAGAAVALRRLYRATGTEPWLGEEDRKAAACISPVGGWAYGAPDLEFTVDVARALVGHPRVMWSRDPERRLEVVEKRPSVRVIENDDGSTKLCFHPPSPAGRSPVVERVGDVIEVYPLEGKTIELARRIGSGIDLPAAARSRLQPLISRLARTVTVESDVDPAVVAGREVEADPRPVLRLGRAGAGLRVELHVAPLGLEGPMRVPGAGGRSMAAQVAGERVLCTRDLERETALAAEVEARCPTLARAESLRGARCFEQADGLEVLLELWALGDDAVQIWTGDDPLEVLPERTLGHMRISAEASDRDWLALEGELELDQERVLDLRALLDRAPSRRGRFIELDDARFVALSAALAERLDLLCGAREQDREDVRIPPVAAGIFAGWADDLAGFEPSEEMRLRLERAREAASLKPRVPRTFEADLRDYQREGYVWMRRLAHWGAGACLADDMGLGKTVQTLALLVARASAGPALVVAPTSVAGNWADEATRFAPTLRVQLLSGAPGDLSAAGAFDLVIVSYALFALHAEAFTALTWATAVLDEAQSIKNPDTQRARAAFALKANFRLLTTGTPIENRVLELWSLMNFANPGLLGSQASFERRFARPIASDPDGPAMRQLRELVRPFVLRRTKREVLTELPPRTEVVHEVIPTEDEAAFSEALRQEALEELEGAGSSAVIRILAALTRLRQAACAPSLVRPDLDLPSSKLEAFEALAEELIAGGHRALVFSQFTTFLKLARARADAMGWTSNYLDGSTPAAKRRAEVAAFQEGEGALFFISLKAGGTGLNLTGADYVIHLDPWWNPAVEDQASDRAHRMGQTRPVTIYRLVTKGSIEEKVLALHGEKRVLAERVLDGTNAPVATDAEALLRLLR